MTKPCLRRNVAKLRWAFVVLTIVALREPLPGADIAPPDPRVSHVLSNESAALLREIPADYIQHKPKPETVPPALIERAQRLQQRVLAVTEETLQANAFGPDGVWRQVRWAGLPGGWGDAVVESFRMNVILGLKSFAEAGNQLRFWWSLLSQLSKVDKKAGFDLISLDLSGSVLDYWIQLEPAACLALIEETEARFHPQSDPELSSRWGWLTAQYNQALPELARSLPKEKRDSLLAEVALRVHQYWNAEEVPLSLRTRDVATSINRMYASNKIDEASSLLQTWEKRHPSALEDEFWLAQRYFVASIGSGDSYRAAETFRIIEKLVTAGKIDAQGPLFTAVSQSYYQSLPEPLLLHRKKTMETRSSFSPPATNKSQP